MLQLNSPSQHHRGHRRGMAMAGNEVSFGEIGLQATTTCRIDSRQIEAARRAITHHLRRGGGIRIFPDKPVTKKPAEVRMGSGKGLWTGWPWSSPACCSRSRCARRRRARGPAPGIAQAAVPDARAREDCRGRVMARKEKFESLVGMDATRLGKELEDSYRQMFTLRLQVATRQLSNTSEIMRRGARSPDQDAPASARTRRPGR